MRKCIFLFNVVAITLLATSISFAAKLYLKDGKVVEGKIISRSSYAITVMVGKKPSRYFIDEISFIEEEQADEDKATEDVDAWKNEVIENSSDLKIPEQKLKLIIMFIDVSGAHSNLMTNIDQIIARAPEERQSELKELLNVNEIVGTLVPIYNKYYSEYELIELVRFYQSPAGKKVLEVTPKIMKEAMEKSIQYFKEKVNQKVID